MCSEVRTWVKLRPDRAWKGAIPEALFVNLYFQENPLVSCDQPYRKPTQVDGMRILRRSSEISLRN